MWWLSLLLLVLAVPLVLLVWAISRVSKLRFADARGEVVAPEQAPERVLLSLKEQVEPLTAMGFEYLGMRREERGAGQFWQAFLWSAGGMVWAVAEKSDEGDEGRQVKLLSFGNEGSVAITNDGDAIFGEEISGAILLTDSFPTAMAQAEAHAALLTEQQVPVVALEPEVFLNRFEKMANQGLDPLFEKGWLYEDPSRKLKLSPAKLPLVGLAWLKHQLAARKREKTGSSWLLGSNLGQETLADSVPSTSAETEVAAESSQQAPLESMPAPERELAPEAAAVVSSELDEEIQTSEENLLAEERAPEVAAVEAMPIGPKAEEGELEEQVLEPVLEEAVEEPPPSKPAIEIPGEDGLPRDWALYQRQASEKSWGYWFGGFGGRAFLFLSLLLFSLWMAFSADWGLRIVLFGLVALLAHEVGHALVMLARRSWDWSQFLVPIPRAMKARQWPIKGGWLELATTLAGPVPGLVFGWFIFSRAYFGTPTSDLLLDLALASVVVNSVTLLPFLPLDGGRLLDMVMLRRSPALRTVALFLAGLVFAALVFAGGGVLAGVFALLMWAGIPGARRRSKLLPWFRANAKEDEEKQIVTAFKISRERSQRKAFKGAAGIAKLDELMGLGQARKLGFLGALAALVVMGVGLSAPLVLPVAGIASNGQEWWQKQKEVEGEAKKYLGALRPLRKGNPRNAKKEVEAESSSLNKLDEWQERLSKNATRPEALFTDASDLNSLRVMKWRRAAHWIAEESSQQRHLVAREAARAMRQEAVRAADQGNRMQAFRDLSTALLIIIECEPRHSLEAWVAWMELEREILKDVEDVSSRYQLDDTYVKWYENALMQCPRPTSRKIAGLILAESQSFESLVRGLNIKDLFPSRTEKALGRRFLASMQGVGDLVSVESLQEKQMVAETFAQSSSIRGAVTQLLAKGKLPAGVQQSLQRIENNYSFRQIAMSALKVKRVGMDGAREELAQLREDYGYTARLDESNERRSLKLSRVNPSGEIVEMEWLLRQ